MAHATHLGFAQLISTAAAQLRDKINELRGAHATWNATMLAYPPGSYSYDVKEIDADRY